MPRYFRIGVFLLLLAASSAFAAPPSPWEIDATVGLAAPDFSLHDLSGKKISLSDLKGKVVLLNFWASWCPPCREEIPSLEELYSRYRDRGLVVLAVSTDTEKSDVESFLEKKKPRFPVLLDLRHEASRLYKVFSLPTSFLIDKRGKITRRFLGEYDWTSKEVLKKIDPLL